MTDPLIHDLRSKSGYSSFLRTCSEKIGWVRLVIGGVSFLVLTVGIFWYQLYRIQGEEEVPRWDQLRWGYLLLILLCLPMETLAAGLRIWVVCRVLHPGMSLWTCIKAEWANVAVSMLTPSQSGGGPAQIYILNREGLKVESALTVSLLSFAGTVVVLFLMGLYTLLNPGINHGGAFLVGGAVGFHIRRGSDGSNRDLAWSFPVGAWGGFQSRLAD